MTIMMKLAHFKSYIGSFLSTKIQVKGNGNEVDEERQYLRTSYVCAPQDGAVCRVHHQLWRVHQEGDQLPGQELLHHENFLRGCRIR